MNQILCIVFYVSLAGGAIILWTSTTPVALGKRLGILGCFAWMVLLLSVENRYDYYVRFYWIHNAENFMREVAEKEKWFGDNSAERDEIIGLAFTEPKTLAGSAENVRQARERMKNKSVGRPIRQSADRISE